MCIRDRTNTGINLPTAYVHIANFGGNKSKIQLNLTVYKDQEAFQEGRIPVEQLRAELDVPFGATMTQMYSELKKQDPFKNATDI